VSQVAEVAKIGDAARDSGDFLGILAEMRWQKIPWTLASASPRRLHLLRQIGLDPRVIPADIVEKHDHLSPAQSVLKNACRKAEAVLPQVESGILLAADTIVLVDDLLLGKPTNSAEAKEMLRILSNRWHLVLTGFTLRWIDYNHTAQHVETTRVHFRRLEDEEIHDYVQTREPLDKAGSYGMQEVGGVFVDRIEGCYFNVVGLPLPQIIAILQEWLASNP